MENKKTTFQLIAKTLFGLEEILAGDLTGIGALDVEILKRAVSFRGDNELMYKANYLCRTALRILKPIAGFEVDNEDDLYRNVRKIEWWKYMDVDDTLAIDGVVSNSVFTHSKYVALKTKDAIVDSFREKFDKRPSVNIVNPTLRINTHIYKNQCTLSLDSSGDSLHKRGYRIITDKAPINEVLAAGMILLSGWQKDCNFVDPMCGSGTILIEAALFANNIPPGYYRKGFGFEKWKDFDADLWNNIKKESLSEQTEFEYKIIGSDSSRKAIGIAKQNKRFASLHKDIEICYNSIENQVPPEGKGMLITNPPYGERLKSDDLIQLYKTIGDVLKKKYNGYTAWIISSDPEVLKFVGLKPSKKIILFNGPLECRFAKYEIYEGSRKRRQSAVGSQQSAVSD